MKSYTILFASLVCCLTCNELKGCELPPSDLTGRRNVNLVTMGDKVNTNIKEMFKLPNTKKELVFKIRACADGFITLSNYPSLSDGDRYIICIGGWGNSKSFIKRHGQKEKIGFYKGVLLKCLSYIRFWISWADGFIKVGRGDVVGKGVFLQMADSDWKNTQTVEYIGIASHWGNKANWMLNLMYDKDASNGENNCSTDLNSKEYEWCSTKPCHKDSTCLSNETTYNCYCDDTSNNYGAHCEREFVICPSNPCQNGAACVNGLRGHSKCECPRGYKGDFCNIGFSSDDIYVTYELLTMAAASSKIPYDQDFEITGFLINHHNKDGWEYTGKISKPDHSFGSFRLFTHQDNGVTGKLQDDEQEQVPATEATKDKKLTLAVGLGAFFGFLFLSSLVTGFIILVKKGYIKKPTSQPTHVMNYNRMAEHEHERALV